MEVCTKSSDDLASRDRAGHSNEPSVRFGGQGPRDLGCL